MKVKKMDVKEYTRLYYYNHYYRYIYNIDGTENNYIENAKILERTIFVYNFGIHFNQCYKNWKLQEKIKML